MVRSPMMIGVYTCSIVAITYDNFDFYREVVSSVIQIASDTLIDKIALVHVHVHLYIESIHEV